MPNTRFTCPDCGAVSDHLLVNGYAFGDRLLEGVQFVVTVGPSGAVAVANRAEDAKYMAGLNAKKWLKAAREYVADADDLTCPACGTDVGGIADALANNAERSPTG
jgi:predicted RNA-binding Zn-ribbon protein involved in translation (DUF1610 family)